MEFIVATGEHVGRMCEITEQAKRQLRGLGIDQWQKGYPSRAVWEQDVADGCTYLALDKGAVQGVFAFKADPDPSYAVIDGAWLTSNDNGTSAGYASLHRVCVADESKGKGVAGALFSFAFDLARAQGLESVRIDTHPGNLPMRRAIEKAGFRFCGEIRLAEGPEQGDIRIAFEKTLACAE